MPTITNIRNTPALCVCVRARARASARHDRQPSPRARAPRATARLPGHSAIEPLLRPIVEKIDIVPGPAFLFFGARARICTSARRRAARGERFGSPATVAVVVVAFVAATIVAVAVAITVAVAVAAVAVAVVGVVGVVVAPDTLDTAVAKLAVAVVVVVVINVVATDVVNDAELSVDNVSVVFSASTRLTTHNANIACGFFSVRRGGGDDVGVGVGE